MWRRSPKFLDIIRRVWSAEIPGIIMYQVMKKFEAIKAQLKMLSKEIYYDIQAADIQAYNNMMYAQQRMHEYPRNMLYIEEN